jgi:murein DD-endopeptidase MepM/ murein hydrolase activator NlpD
MAKFSFPSFRPSRIFTGLAAELRGYFQFLYHYIRVRGYVWFAKFELLKDVLVDLLYKRRGKYTRPFLHFGTIALVFLVITFGPFIVEQRQKENGQENATVVINSAYAYSNDLSTNQSDLVKSYRGGEVQDYLVKDGDTLSSIAQTFSLNVNTIVWENDIDPKVALKPGQHLRILPVDGVRHKVQRGETIYTIAKSYGLDESQAQAIADYPFNEFKNYETFELAVGSTIMVPGGALLNAQFAAAPTIASVLTPDAGAVTATGQFVWPAAGRITQGYSFYHKAFDIANHDGGPILAADSGVIIHAGWDTTGYGNMIEIDHGNGFITLYGHLSVLQVQVGQHVSKGSVIGQMGSTGHSTGTHCHFEIRHGGVLENPGNYLK